MELAWIFAVLFPYLALAVDLKPRFNRTSEHVTVVEGGRVILPCSVANLGNQKVIWVNPRKTLISLNDRRLIDDHRISVERPYTQIWNLLIREVRYNDSGIYECRVNTSPRIIKELTLDVQVPPKILSEVSSDKIDLREGETATLVCNVTGVPQPNVTWYRRNEKRINRGKERIGLEGEVLVIHNVSRDCDDVYECYVDNGVSPPVSKAIAVTVNYPPEVKIAKPRRIGQYLGKETILECDIQAYPFGTTVWVKDGRAIDKNRKNFEVEMYKNDEMNFITLALRIKPVQKSDFGRYVCRGTNFLGEDSEEMVLYELKLPPTTTTTTTTTTPRRLRIKSGGGKSDKGTVKVGYRHRDETDVEKGRGNKPGQWRNENDYKGGDAYDRSRNRDPSTSSLNSQHSRGSSRGNEEAAGTFARSDGENSSNSLNVSVWTTLSYLALFAAINRILYNICESH